MGRHRVPTALSSGKGSVTHRRLKSQTMAHLTPRQQAGSLAQLGGRGARLLLVLPGTSPPVAAPGQVWLGSKGGSAQTLRSRY